MTETVVNKLADSFYTPFLEGELAQEEVTDPRLTQKRSGPLLDPLLSRVERTEQAQERTLTAIQELNRNFAQGMVKLRNWLKGSVQDG